MNAGAAAKIAGAGFVRELEDYFEQRFGRPVRVEDVRALSGDGGAQTFGDGVPVRVSLAGGPVREVVVHTIALGARDAAGDAASRALLAFEAFNSLPHHARAVDVGAVLDHGARVSLAGAKAMFFVTAFADGAPYVRDLDRIAETGVVDDRDRDRVDVLAGLLARTHGERRTEPGPYVRRLARLVGGDDGIAGIIDGFDATPIESFGSRAQLVGIEQRCVEWRHRSKSFAHRLARVHGDFRPRNVFFRDETRMPTLLGRSHGAFGEPADDVAALVVDYLVRALHRDGGMRGPFAELWTRFFHGYLAETRDDELGLVLPPYLARRALALASPRSSPSFAPELRRRLLGFVERILAASRFDFDAPATWLP